MVSALVVGGANPAFADSQLDSSLAETQKMTSSVPWMDADYTAKKLPSPTLLQEIWLKIRLEFQGEK